MLFAMYREPRVLQCRSKAIKTHAPVHKRLPTRAPDNNTRTWILAPGRPSDKDNVLHAPAQLRLARSHARHETKTKTKRSRSPGYGGRTSRTSSPKPPIYMAMSEKPGLKASPWIWSAFQTICAGTWCIPLPKP